MADANAIARLSIVLDGVMPRVRRFIDVPLDVTLEELHAILQIAMGWKSSHIYNFQIGGTFYGYARPNSGLHPVTAEKTRLGPALASGIATFSYVYDLGDNWGHRIDVENIGGADPGVSYPRLIDAQGRCPPENVGGPEGFAEFLDAIQDPSHLDHGRFLEWYGGLFNPDDVDVGRIARELGQIARRRRATAAPVRRLG